jgi:hypothetical protein
MPPPDPGCASRPPPQALSLRDSSFTWRDRPPDLRALRQLRSLDLRRSNWLSARGTPWDEQLLLPASLEALDLIGGWLGADWVGSGGVVGLRVLGRGGG